MRGDWMQTVGGRKYYPTDPRPEDIHIGDVAHHLGMLVRFTGAVRDFYSIAEHCVHVSNLVPKEWAFAALLHEVPEAYLNDLNRPVKYSPYLMGYRELEKINWQAAAKRFCLPMVLPPCVKDADVAALFAERDELLTPMEGETWGMGLKSTLTMPRDWIQCWEPRKARDMFLEQYHRLS